MKHGARPTERDNRDYSFHRTFGTINADLLKNLPAEYSVDASLTMPDQRTLDPYSCTAYTTCDLGTDQDGTVYQPKYTYMKTLFMQGLPPTTNGSDIRPALKSAKVYGLLPKDDTPEILRGRDEDFTADQGHWPTAMDAIAGKLEHRKGAYFNIYDDGGLDWMDSFRSALWVNKADHRAISIGTPWFVEWLSPQNGIVTENFVYDGNPSHYSWHNWAIKGWKVINGETYLIGKSWQGRNYGDNGWHYISRKTINRVMDIRGSVAFTLADATPEDIRTIQLSIFEQVLLFVGRLIGLKILA